MIQSIDKYGNSFACTCGREYIVSQCTGCGKGAPPKPVNVTVFDVVPVGAVITGRPFELVRREPKP